MPGGTGESKFNPPTLMKTSSTLKAFLIAGIATTSIGLVPILQAQTMPVDTAQSSKSTDSTAEKNNATTGTGATAASAPDKTSSKDTTNSLDKNPSTASTGSADKSATKDPNGPPDQPSTLASKKSADKSSEKSGPVSDQEFIQNAAQGGMAEVELGKLAQEKGSSADVKQFGSKMVTDHSKADADLKTVADKKGIAVPTSLDAKHRASVERFSHLSGAAFDRAYVHAMVKDHEKDASEFREEANSAQDPDVKSFADSTLKVIETHLSDIKTIQGKMQ